MGETRHHQIGWWWAQEAELVGGQGVKRGQSQVAEARAGGQRRLGEEAKVGTKKGEVHRQKAVRRRCHRLVAHRDWHRLASRRERHMLRRIRRQLLRQRVAVYQQSSLVKPPLLPKLPR